MGIGDRRQVAVSINGGRREHFPVLTTAGGSAAPVERDDLPTVGASSWNGRILPVGAPISPRWDSGSLTVAARHHRPFPAHRSGFYRGDRADLLCNGACHPRPVRTFISASAHLLCNGAGRKTTVFLTVFSTSTRPLKISVNRASHPRQSVCQPSRNPSHPPVRRSVCRSVCKSSRHPARRR